MSAARAFVWAGAVLCVLNVTCAPPAMAHDFWIQPAEFWPTAAKEVAVSLFVGHGQTRDRSQIASRRITRFSALTPSGEEIDLREQRRARGAIEDVRFATEGAGTYVVMLETDAAARSVLAANRFNAYLQSEGLTPALEHRAREGKMQLAGTEKYSRHAKAIVQVGASATLSNVTEPLGLRLEIVPEHNPYALPKVASLPVRVLFEGRPLAGALVKLSQLGLDAAREQGALTNADGHVSFPMPESGDWLLNVAWTKPLRDSEVDFETRGSSLTFSSDEASGGAQP